MVLRVGDPSVPGPNCDRVGVVVVTKGGSHLAEPGHDGAGGARVVRLDHLDVALLRVGDPVIAGARIDSDAPRPVEAWLSGRARSEPASTTLAEQTAGRAHHRQPLVDGVDRDEIIGSVEADAAHLVVQRTGAVS